MKILDIKCAKTHTFGLYNLFLGSMFHFNFIPGIQRVLFKALLYISLEFLLCHNSGLSNGMARLDGCNFSAPTSPYTWLQNASITIYLPVTWWCFDWRASTLPWVIPWISLPETIFWQVLDTTKNRIGRVEGRKVSSRVLPCGIFKWLLWTFPSFCDTWISRNLVRACARF